MANGAVPDSTEGADSLAADHQDLSVPSETAV